MTQIYYRTTSKKTHHSYAFACSLEPAVPVALELSITAEHVLPAGPIYSWSQIGTSTSHFPKLAIALKPLESSGQGKSRDKLPTTDHKVDKSAL